MKALLPLLLLIALPVAAQEEAAPEQGASTREWLELQKSGNTAAPESRPLPGEAADKVYQRYVDSYGRPLPETFPREGFGTGGGSGGASSK